MKIIGIDSGLIYTGWGVIETLGYDEIKYVDCGVVKTSSRDAMEKRLSKIYSQISCVIQKYEVDKVAMEEVFINVNPKSSQKLIMARTAAYLAACNLGFEICEFTPNMIKKQITGNGHSSKNQVYNMVQKLLNTSLKKNVYDPMDALAVAICCAFVSSQVSYLKISTNSL